MEDRYSAAIDLRGNSKEVKTVVDFFFLFNF